MNLNEQLKGSAFWQTVSYETCLCNHMVLM